MPERQDWQKWDEERKRFEARGTEGLTKDLAALEAHIKTLTEVCPTDKAGWPVGRALTHISKMTKFHNNVKSYLETCRS